MESKAGQVVGAAGALQGVLELQIASVEGVGGGEEQLSSELMLAGSKDVGVGQSQ